MDRSAKGRWWRRVEGMPKKIYSGIGGTAGECGLCHLVFKLPERRGFLTTEKIRSMVYAHIKEAHAVVRGAGGKA